MFRSMAGVAQTELDFGCCFTGKSPIFANHCTWFHLIYIGNINFVTQTTAEYSIFG